MTEHGLISADDGYHGRDQDGMIMLIMPVRVMVTAMVPGYSYGYGLSIEFMVKDQFYEEATVETVFEFVVKAIVDFKFMVKAMVEIKFMVKAIVESECSRAH